MRRCSIPGVDKRSIGIIRDDRLAEAATHSVDGTARDHPEPLPPTRSLAEQGAPRQSGHRGVLLLPARTCGRRCANAELGNLVLHVEPEVHLVASLVVVLPGRLAPSAWVRLTSTTERSQRTVWNPAHGTRHWRYSVSSAHQKKSSRGTPAVWTTAAG